ncbi:MAG: diacylglycerol kinase, partial [bacterium]
TGMFAQIYFSFYYAFRGMATAVATQRNMRFHLFAALNVFTFSLMFSFDSVHKAFLFMIVTFVIAMEVLNTCIEAFTDMASPGYHRLAKVTKDTAATAVLITALGTLMAAGYYFLPPVIKMIADGGYRAEIAPRLLATGAVAGSVVLFWLSRAAPSLLVPAIFICGGIAGYGSGFLAWAERDWIALCALVYFGFFLLLAVARGRGALAAFAGQLAGLIAFSVVTWG